MQYLISSLMFLIPSLGMVAGLSASATVAIFLLGMSYRGLSTVSKNTNNFNILNWIPWTSHGMTLKYKTELLFTTWCLISCLLAIKPLNSLINFIQIFIILFFAFVISNSNSFQNRLQLKKALISGIFTAILLFFIEYSSHGFLTKIFKPSFSLYMLDRGCALLSITAWIAIIILLSSGKKRHAFMLYVLVLYLLSISDSLASFLGFTIGGIVFILARFMKSIFFPLIAIGLITCSLLFPVIAKQMNPIYLSEKYLSNQDSSAHRLFIWHFVANKAFTKQHTSESSRQDEFQGELARRIGIREHRRDLQNSLVSGFMKYAVGYGFGSSKHIEVNNSEMVDYKGTKWHPLPLHPHNNILQITLELGVIGLILFLSLIYKYLKQISNIKNNNFRAISYACFINYYIIGMISYNIWQIWWISSGILVLILMKLLVKPDIVIDN